MATCSLTKKEGEFVDCHLLPKFATKRVQSLPAYEIDGTTKPKKRFSHGWSDKSLVTREGEDVLEYFDDEAANFLKGNKLIYSERRNPKTTQLFEFAYQSPSAVEFPVRNMTRLRLFALSLLWRAAASNIPEFSGIAIRPKRLEDLRVMLNKNECGELSDFPASIGVFDSSDELAKITPGIMSDRKQNMARFFLDGAVLYISVTRKNQYMQSLGKFVMGSQSQDLLVPILPAFNGWHSIKSQEILESTITAYNYPRRPIL